jgi:hypothetical protein
MKTNTLSNEIGAEKQMCTKVALQLHVERLALPPPSFVAVIVTGKHKVSGSLCSDFEYMSNYQSETEGCLMYKFLSV